METLGLDIEILVLLTYIIFGYVSLLFVAWVNFFFAKTPTGQNFNFKFWWIDNKIAVAGSLTGIPLILTIAMLVPEFTEIFRLATGISFDFSSLTNGAAFSLGGLLYAALYKVNKKIE